MKMSLVSKMLLKNRNLILESVSALKEKYQKIFILKILIHIFDLQKLNHYNIIRNENINDNVFILLK